jgi:hypothetical protein
MSPSFRYCSLLLLFFINNAFATPLAKIKVVLNRPTLADSISIDVFKCYLSNIVISDSNNKKDLSPSNCHLLDFSNSDTALLFVSPFENANSFEFNLGIDSIINTSGALGGQLDPSNGMYWTWQSGYINFKIEGSSPISAARNHEFQFHAGGYTYPNNALNSIKFELQPNKAFQLEIDLELFFKLISLKNLNHVMSPGPNAVKISQALASCFKIIQDEK